MSETFDWNYPTFDNSHFHALANFSRFEVAARLSLLRYLIFCSKGIENLMTMDMDIRLAWTLPSLINYQILGMEGSLKRRFLDCLAIFAANKKGATAVACSAMKEVEDKIVIWISRNQGFSDVDKRAFDDLERLLGSLSRKNGVSLLSARFLNT